MPLALRGQEVGVYIITEIERERGEAGKLTGQQVSIVEWNPLNTHTAKELFGQVTEAHGYFFLRTPKQNNATAARQWMQKLTEGASALRYKIFIWDWEASLLVGIGKELDSIDFVRKVTEKGVVPGYDVVLLNN